MTASIAGKYVDMVACNVTKTRRLKGSLKRNNSSLPQSEKKSSYFSLSLEIAAITPQALL